MAELLYIKASPRKERSFSIAAANAFVEAYRERHPEDRVIELDLFEGSLEGLIIAEVEFPTVKASRSFAPPAWFGREVTRDARYKNRNLALDGLRGEPG